MAKAIYTNKFLELLVQDGPRSSKPFYFHYPTLRMYRKLTKKAYYSILSQMQVAGTVSVVEKNNQRFVKITSKGQLELLIQKAKMPKSEKWDGKWRLVLFDIPEKSKDKRDKLRRLLKSNNYFKLQASVFISPHALNGEALEYLNKSGLIEYIRILRVEQIDNDTKLKKHFKL